MKRELRTALLALVALTNITTTAAQDDATVRKELEAQYLRLAEAHDKEDLKAILALKTADFGQ